MFKKLLSVVIVGLIFTAYNSEAKDVTLDMLVGQWACFPALKESHLSDDGLSFIYKDTQTKEENSAFLRFVYTKITEPNLDLMRFSIPDPNMIINKSLFSAKKNSVLIYKDKKIANFEEYKYINDDKFEYVTITEAFYYDKNKKVSKKESQAYYLGLNCSRIKEDSPFWVDVNVDDFKN